jgi:hypothetical protein
VRWKLKNVKSDTMLTIFVIVAALGLVAVVAVQVISIAQESEARGCPGTSPAANASKTRCFRP